MTPKEERWNKQMNLWRVQKLLPPVQLPAPTAMDITYSRAYLRGIPEQLRRQEKQQAIQQLYKSVIQYVAHAASAGKTSQLIGEKTYSSLYYQMMQRGAPLTDEEILAALNEKFPDCVISFQEAWADTPLGQRALQKCILIDWS